MRVKEVLAQLESRADEARRAHNVKSGAPANQFGVKLGDIRAIAKKIKTDHALALELWDTGNVEAQLLATLGRLCAHAELWTHRLAGDNCLVPDGPVTSGMGSGAR